MEPKILTLEGKQKMEDELKDLKTRLLPEVIERIERAKELGDLSENAEYQEAKDTQGFIAARIAELESLLKQAIIAEQSSGDQVGMGSCFIVRDANGAEKEFCLVGFNEADPVNGKISVESPLGKAFYTRKKGDQVDVETPRGEMHFEILEIKQ